MFVFSLVLFSHTDSNLISTADAFGMCSVPNDATDSSSKGRAVARTRRAVEHKLQMQTTVSEFLRRKAVERQTTGVRMESKEDGTLWYHPVSLSALVSLIQRYSDEERKLVVGNTSIGIFKHNHPRVYIDVQDVAELKVRIQREAVSRDRERSFGERKVSTERYI